jgi:hypothetical protein
MQECYALPLEDINARQMLQEGRDILRKLDKRAPPPPQDRMDTTSTISALPYLPDSDAEEVVTGPLEQVVPVGSHEAAPKQQSKAGRLQTP